jgi:hypothetical protein
VNNDGQVDAVIGVLNDSPLILRNNEPKIIGWESRQERGRALAQRSHTDDF